MIAIHDLALALGMDAARYSWDAESLIAEVALHTYPETFTIQAYGEFESDLWFGLLATELTNGRV